MRNTGAETEPWNFPLQSESPSSSSKSLTFLPSPHAFRILIPIICNEQLTNREQIIHNIFEQGGGLISAQEKTPEGNALCHFLGTKDQNGTPWHDQLWQPAPGNSLATIKSLAKSLQDNSTWAIYCRDYLLQTPGTTCCGCPDGTG